MNSQGRDVDEKMKSNWNNLGVVDTIFEDEDEDEDDLESLSSSTLSSPFSPLHTGVDAWTIATGKQPDMKIHVRGISFHLHKDVLISKSSYLKRHLSRVSEFTLSPQLKVPSDTFKQIADFCYNNHVIVTPFNVAALRTAAELLEMNGDSDGDESLCDLTESYLCNVLLHNKEFTCTVFLSSLTLLPEAEHTAFITSRCLETLLGLSDDGDNDGDFTCADGLKRVLPEDFRVIMESMQLRFTRSHDLLYRVVDLYFLVYNGKVLSEDQKTQICSCIDCSLLSSPLLIHAVQNARMPLRFVVQAMLIDQLTTHRSIFSALNPTTTRTAAITATKPLTHSTESPATLGAILERDAALRQVAQMRSAIETTCSRIQTLEKELSSMKKLLGEKEDGRRSASSRFNVNINNISNSAHSNHKVARGERGSVSSSMVRLFGGANTNNTNHLSKHRVVGSSSSLSSSFLQSEDHQSPRTNNVKQSFRQRLIKGLKSAFRVSNNKHSKKGGKLGVRDDHSKVIGFNEEEITFDTFAISNSVPHHRSFSVS